jgi:hypothetical protein
MGKNGLQTIFSKAFHKTNRVLGKALTREFNHGPPGKKKFPAD